MKFSLLFILLLLSLTLSAQSATDKWVFHQKPGDGRFSAVAVMKDGRVLVGGGSPNSLFRIYDGINWTWFTKSSFGVSFLFFGNDIAVDSNGLVWLAPGNIDGVTSWNGTNLVNYNKSNSGISSNSIFGVGVDKNGVKWFTNLQSFDGSIWKTYTVPYLDKSAIRHVFIDSKNNVWMYGTPGISLSLPGGLIQPSVCRISNDKITEFHTKYGDNLPVLSGGDHLMGELSDGTVFLAGRTSKGLEMKIFDGASWQNWQLYSGSNLGNSFYGLCVDREDNIFIAGGKDQDIAQIVKFCKGGWTVYNLPLAQGFPRLINDIKIIDSTLWIAGEGGLCSLFYPVQSCKTSGIDNLSGATKFCDLLYLKDGYLIVQSCADNLTQLQYRIYDPLGRLVAQDDLNNEKTWIGNLKPGIYMLHLITKDGRGQAVLLETH